MTRAKPTPQPTPKPAPLAYRLLNACSHCPQTRDHLLRLAGLFFVPTSDTVKVWQDQLFEELTRQGWLRKDRQGLYSLTVKGEAQLGSYFATCGPLKLVRL